MCFTCASTVFRLRNRRSQIPWLDRPSAMSASTWCSCLASGLSGQGRLMRRATMVGSSTRPRGSAGARALWRLGGCPSRRPPRRLRLHGSACRSDSHHDRAEDAAIRHAREGPAQRQGIGPVATSLGKRTSQALTGPYTPRTPGGRATPTQTEALSEGRQLMQRLLGVHLGRNTLSFPRWPLALLLSQKPCPQSPPPPGTPTRSDLAYVSGCLFRAVTCLGRCCSLFALR
jgi:hypothetical protein